MKKDNIKVSLTVVALTALLLSSCVKNESGKHANVNVDSLQAVVRTLQDSRSQLEANKKLVADFYQKLFGDKDVDAIDHYIGETYTQHNPALADGRDVLKKAVIQWFKGAPKEKIDIRHLSADGDLVYIHSKSMHEGKMSTVIDIFRLENNKIVEHWDVIQAIPEKSANPHPMF